ncbi:dTDP-4-dehydrorhamnose reductase [Solemya pervernicosa gill symbiont]|uniref:dTDP-4-dehydrorhamnose reductase n=2 Tax=Gammaproteobacteria incertae sedis TaxID=118884 RepID=A0A1T2L728_9GAMM|nr:dTDP-4-dehydrorhamnose reductase [Candidatus Reidiella endopervernicosa]OOZ40909.1 dTDP-4-dehydrorhamnose reductase [Solemya pervernicosa gill symbiont]QKQ26114.1 dTDP-4-dehydrorhamnose reductase [Candidatus Reidiella endopervernicosa]
MSPKRILLLGANGQVGWELQRTLAPLGQVVAAGRAGGEISIDLASADSIHAVINEVRPSLIVNAAAYTAVDRAEQEAELAEAVNATAPGILAEEAKTLGAGLIHFSTDYVFDGEQQTPYLESDSTNPQGVYGRTKLVGEQAVAASGCDYLLLRTSWVYGLRGHNFLLTMQRLARERDHLSVVEDQYGAPTWSRMIAETTAQLVGQVYQSEQWRSELNGLYHLSCGGMVSWHGFAESILAAMGDGIAALEAIPSSGYPTPAKRPAYSVLDNGKLQRVFGLELPGWRSALALALADQHG